MEEEKPKRTRNRPEDAVTPAEAPKEQERTETAEKTKKAAAKPKKAEKKPKSWTGKVAAGRLNVRKGPAMDREVCGTPLHRGTKLEIVEEKDGWGRMPDGVWVLLKFVERIE